MQIVDAQLSIVRLPEPTRRANCFFSLSLYVIGEKKKLGKSHFLKDMVEFKDLFHYQQFVSLSASTLRVSCGIALMPSVRKQRATVLLPGSFGVCSRGGARGGALWTIRAMQLQGRCSRRLVLLVEIPVNHCWCNSSVLIQPWSLYE